MNNSKKKKKIIKLSVIERMEIRKEKDKRYSSEVYAPKRKKRYAMDTAYRKKRREQALASYRKLHATGSRTKFLRDMEASMDRLPSISKHHTAFRDGAKIGLSCEGEFITKAEMAELIHRSSRALHYWIAGGKFPAPQYTDTTTGAKLYSVREASKLITAVAKHLNTHTSALSPKQSEAIHEFYMALDK